jgi:hypothetical protein
VNKQEKQAIMDSLSDEQRKGIANIIQDADIADTYQCIGDGEGSVCVDDARGTLDNLAYYFRTYDPSSAID